MAPPANHRPAEGAGPERPRRLIIAAYSLDLPHFACARLRLIGPAQALGSRVALRWGAASDGTDYAISAQAMEEADLIVFQRYFPMEATWPLVEKALNSGVPVVYDTDDDFLAVPPDHPMAPRLAPVVPFARELLARALLVTVSTPMLAKAFSGLARRIAVLPNLVDQALWAALAPTPASVAHPGPQAGPGPDGSGPDESGHGGSGPVRVLFAGTPSHAGDLQAIWPALAAVQERFGPGVRLMTMGCPAPGPGAEEHPFLTDYAAYARQMAALKPDIGLAPLGDTAFNRCKSAVKWLEYSALGAAGIYADLPPYGDVAHGLTGLKAGPDPADWEQALTRLIQDSQFRVEMGRRARREALGRFSLRARAEEYLRVWREVLRRP